MMPNQSNKRDLDFKIDIDFEGENSRLKDSYTYKMR